MMKWMNKCPGCFRDKRIWLIGLLIAFSLLFFAEDSAMTQEEKRVAQILSRIEGAGRVQVSIYTNGTESAFSNHAKTLVGAVAVCEGAGDIAVRLRLTEALQTLLGLDGRQVLVLEMEENSR